MKRFFIITAIILSSLASLAQTKKDEMAVRKVLAMQAQAWNAGDLENFMQTYWRNDSLMFIGKSGVTYGWEPTFDRYKKNYPDTAAMGKLTFNLLELKPLSSLYYFVVGEWRLDRTIGNIGGHFTLLFKKIDGEWFIIADHSS